MFSGEKKKTRYLIPQPVISEAMSEYQLRGITLWHLSFVGLLNYPRCCVAYKNDNSIILVFFFFLVIFLYATKCMGRPGHGLFVCHGLLAFHLVSLLGYGL